MAATYSLSARGSFWFLLHCSAGTTPFPEGSIGTDTYLDFTSPKIVALKARYYADPKLKVATKTVAMSSTHPYLYDGETYIRSQALIRLTSFRSSRC